jgi:hypothetical protein
MMVMLPTVSALLALPLVPATVVMESSKLERSVMLEEVPTPILPTLLADLTANSLDVVMVSSILTVENNATQSTCSFLLTTLPMLLTGGAMPTANNDVVLDPTTLPSNSVIMDATMMIFPTDAERTA